MDPSSRLWLALLTFVGSVLASLLVRWLAARAVRRMARWSRPGSSFHDLVVVQRGDRRIGHVAFLATLTLGLALTLARLGEGMLTGWVSATAEYLPRVFLAVVLLLAGTTFGKLARHAIARSLSPGSSLAPAHIGRLTEMLVVATATLVALQQLRVEVGLLVTLATIALGVVLGAGGLAVALGSRLPMTNILSAHSVRELYRPGDTVRIGGFEGTVVRFAATSVVLRTAEGETSVPAQLFLREASTRLDPKPH